VTIETKNEILNKKNLSW